MAVFTVVNDQVLLSTDAVESADTFSNGLLLRASDGAARAVGSSGDEYANGLLVTDVGQVAFIDATSSLPVDTVWSNGLPRFGGRLCVANAVAAYWSNGVPFASNGAVAALYFSPSSLFASGEQGAWYDPSDFSTMFQDSAGTTPVTAVEQPVGLLLDKSKGLTLGSELVTNANLASAWTVAGANTVTQDGSAVRVNYIDNNAGALVFLASGPLSSNLSAGKRYRVTFEAKAEAGTAVNIVANDGVTSTAFSLTNSYQSFTAYLLYSTGTPYVGRVNDGSLGPGEAYSVRNISVREIAGNHAFQSTAASRPVLRQEANGAYYLAFDGVDDGMVTSSINFSATDKMTVFAGVQKLSDAATGVLAELSSSIATNAGSFYFVNADALGRRWSSAARGSAPESSSQAAFDTTAAPDIAVISIMHDIAGDLSTIRRNAVPGTDGTGDKGTGNYGNYPLFIGRRGGTTLPFNGRLYGLIVRGAASTAQQITQAESWMNQRTRAF